MIYLDVATPVYFLSLIILTLCSLGKCEVFVCINVIVIGKYVKHILGAKKNLTYYNF